jgi:aminopeptidase
MYKKYASLLVDYCIKSKPGQKVLVRTTTLAEPLLKELYIVLLQRGAFVEFMLSFEDEERLFLDYASEDQLKQPSEFYTYAIENFDAIITLKAPFNLKSTANADSTKKRHASQSMLPIRQTLQSRSVKKELTWVLALFPTQSAAQEAGMSLQEFSDFVFNACFLNEADPIAAWKELSQKQQKYVDFLNTIKHLQYKGLKTDLSFSVQNRLWINSDGIRNMPSGEVFSSPVEDSVNGHIYFDVPTVYDGCDVQGIHLDIENGIIQIWKADIGQEVLDRVFSIEGARMFGEVAIGTNYTIQRPIKNILFDEKIGGTIHMAVGSTYPETGGKNQSAVHWDMIKYMQNGGQIFADSRLIYENGNFIESAIKF